MNKKLIIIIILIRMNIVKNIVFRCATSLGMHRNFLHLFDEQFNDENLPHKIYLHTSILKTPLTSVKQNGYEYA